MSKFMPMPTLCGIAGPLPESLRPFLNSKGDLQIGDAFGLEAQWIISQVSANGDAYPEDDWTLSQIEVDSLGVGCVRCGDEDADTINCLCDSCDVLSMRE